MTMFGPLWNRSYWKLIYSGKLRICYNWSNKGAWGVNQDGLMGRGSMLECHLSTWPDANQGLGVVKEISDLSPGFSSSRDPLSTKFQVRACRR